MEKFEKRNSNFECLRIIGMLLIVLHHLVLHGNFSYDMGNFFSKFVYLLFYSGGKLGVALFIMITGYFMILKKEQVKIKKLISLEAQVLFYSVFGFFVFLLFGNRSITFYEVVKSFFPNLFDAYWFFSSYFALCLFIPYINMMVMGLSQLEFKRLLVIGFAFLILIPSLIIYKASIHEGILLLYYYLVGAYIRLFVRKKYCFKKCLFVFLFFYLAIIGVSLYLRDLALTNSILLDYVDFFSKLNSILIFICAVVLFIGFCNLKSFNSSFVNYLGSLSFGVYLFHENFLVRDLIWNYIFKVGNWYSSPLFFLFGIVAALLVYVFGGVLELCRKYLKILIMHHFRKLLDNYNYKSKWGKNSFIK